MAYKVIVNEKATKDALQAYLYYEEKQKGLGERFLTKLEIRYRQLAENPQYYSHISADKEKTLRGVVVTGFPYLIFFDIIGNEVIVYLIHNHYQKRGLDYE